MLQVAPDANATVSIGKIVLTAKDEVVTFAVRNLEPYRGFPNFMRSLPAILANRPKAHVLIMGGDETSCGSSLPNGLSFWQQMLAELGATLDMSRVHFKGKVPYYIFLKILQISSVHVYLTYPFVPFCSMLEAMASGCLVVASRIAPVEEVIRDGGKDLLVDFFNVAEISETVIATLKDSVAYRAICDNARRTIVERYDLKTIWLPAQLNLMEWMANRLGRGC
jgi:glycosyltransferase involved in cell wall biosynthesis